MKVVLATPRKNPSRGHGIGKQEADITARPDPVNQSRGGRVEPKKGK